MDAISLSDAEYLTDLVERVEAGESIDIMRDGKAIARLVPVEELVPVAPRQPIDVDALRRLTERLPLQSRGAGEFVRAMRDAEPH